MTDTQTQTAGGMEERIITLEFTRAEIEALNLAAARLGMTVPEVLAWAVESIKKIKSVLTEKKLDELERA